MFKWLKRFLKKPKRKPSRQLEYHRLGKEGVETTAGLVSGCIGFHLVVTSMGGRGYHLVSKAAAVYPDQWQRLWEEFNDATQRFQWADENGDPETRD